MARLIPDTFCNYRVVFFHSVTILSHDGGDGNKKKSISVERKELEKLRVKTYLPWQMIPLLQKCSISSAISSASKDNNSCLLCPTRLASMKFCRK